MDDRTRQLEAACGVAYRIADACAEAVLRLVEVTGHRVACRRGCNACCDCLAPATLAEAIPIALWLLEREPEQRLNRFREEVRRRRDSLGPELEEIEQAIRRSDSASEGAAEREHLGRVAGAYRRRRLMCPFSAGDSGCEVYPIRPLLCRVHWVADTADHCQHDSPHKVLIIEHPAFSKAIDLAHGVLNGASAEAGCGGRRPLPEAVHHALDYLGMRGSA